MCTDVDPAMPDLVDIPDIEESPIHRVYRPQPEYKHIEADTASTSGESQASNPHGMVAALSPEKAARVGTKDKT